MFRTKGLVAALALAAAGTAAVLVWHRMSNPVPVLVPAGPDESHVESTAAPRVIQAAPDTLRDLPPFIRSSDSGAPYSPRIHVPSFPGEDASSQTEPAGGGGGVSGAAPSYPSVVNDATPPAPPVPLLPAGDRREASATSGSAIRVRTQDGDLAPAPGPSAAAVPVANLAQGGLEAEIARLLRMADDGQVADAHLGLSRLYWSVESDPAARRRVLEVLEPLADRVFFSAEHTLEPPYTVQTGDILQRVGAAYQVPWQYLARINRLADPRRLRAGQTIKVIRGPFEAVVDLSDFEIIVVLGDRWVRHYRIGIGSQEQRTPLGTFPVVEKVEDPPYDGPLGSFASNDPNNPIGEHWIDLGDGYGIHGTIEPDSVGRAASRGCIRMHPDDVEELFHLLVPGSRVLIRE